MAIGLRDPSGSFKRQAASFLPSTLNSITEGIQFLIFMSLRTNKEVKISVVDFSPKNVQYFS